MSETKTLNLTVVSDTELVMTRTFDAPLALVFEACSRKEHLEKWWAGGSDENTVECELDFRPGGRWRFVEHAPDGHEHAFRGEFLEIEAPYRMVQTFEYEGAPGEILVQSIEFTESDGRTLMTASATYPSKATRDAMLDAGMTAGAERAYRKLDALLQTLV
jgi:uncharacterized protein YndB with AHSA1/START domain